MIIRFDIRPDQDGWTTYDRQTNEPAVLAGFASIGLTYDEADELVDLLNTLDLMKGARPTERWPNPARESVLVLGPKALILQHPLD